MGNEGGKEEGGKEIKNEGRRKELRLRQLPDSGSAVLITSIGYYIHVWSPELKLSLPVNQCR